MQSGQIFKFIVSLSWKTNLHGYTAVTWSPHASQNNIVIYFVTSIGSMYTHIPFLVFIGSCIFMYVQFGGIKYVDAIVVECLSSLTCNIL